MRGLVNRDSFLYRCISIPHSIIYIRDGEWQNRSTPRKQFIIVDSSAYVLIYWAPDPACCRLFSTSFISARLRCCAVTLLPQLPEALSPQWHCTSSFSCLYLFVSLHVPVILYPFILHCSTCTILFCTVCLDLQRGYPSVKQYVFLYTE